MGNCCEVVGKDQALIIGLPKSGKTTLLYSWKIPNYMRGKEEEAEDLTADQKEEAVPFHYEQVRIKNYILGIWDVKGGEVMQVVWPTFYRYVQMDIVMFVVNMKNVDEFGEAKRILHTLFNEDELRDSYFMIILNCWSQQFHATLFETLPQEEVLARLGLNEESTFITTNRWKLYSIRVLEIQNGKDGADFEQMQDDIFTLLAKKKKGKA
eukprot:Platyproteum_vivax@DN2698_c0_g1_i1.p1